MGPLIKLVAIPFIQAAVEKIITHVSDFLDSCIEDEPPVISTVSKKVDRSRWTAQRDALIFRAYRSFAHGEKVLGIIQCESKSEFLFLINYIMETNKTYCSIDNRVIHLQKDKDYNETGKELYAGNLPPKICKDYLIKIGKLKIKYGSNK